MEMQEKRGLVMLFFTDIFVFINFTKIPHIVCWIIFKTILYLKPDTFIYFWLYSLHFLYLQSQRIYLENQRKWLEPRDIPHLSSVRFYSWLGEVAFFGMAWKPTLFLHLSMWCRNKTVGQRRLCPASLCAQFHQFTTRRSRGVRAAPATYMSVKEEGGCKCTWM